MLHAGCQRQPLFPAARERTRQLVRPIHQSQVCHASLHGLLAVGHVIQARNKVEVFAYGQIFVKTETLGHVTHLFLDFSALAEHIKTQTGAASDIRRQQAAKHPDDGGFTAAIGT